MTLDKLKEKVNELKAATSETGRKLREIGDLLLTDFELDLGNGEILQPLRVEPYYFGTVYCDSNTHGSEKQKGADRFGKLYFHEKGRGGIDVCLSCGDYCFSYLIKNSRIGETCFKQIDLYEKLAGRKDELEQRMVLREKEHVEQPVFHTYRVGLVKGPDSEPLASLIEIERKGKDGKTLYSWQKGNGKEWTITAYLLAHPQADKTAFYKKYLGYVPKNKV